MTTITISEEIAQKIPAVTLVSIESTVVIEDKNDELWGLIDKKVNDISASLKVEAIGKMDAVAASRRGYKVCGKDPARYRLSAEALLRRIVKQKDFFQINNVVDLLNLVSISTGYSIGGYDADKISGDIRFSIGRGDEEYQAIGRGELNIESLPVFRDSLGAFGSPTSDSVRTAVTNETKRFLMVIVDFGYREGLNDAVKTAVGLLLEYAGACNIRIKKIVYDKADK